MTTQARPEPASVPVSSARTPRVQQSFFTGPPIRMSWGGIFAGTVSALGVWILLYALGMALGLTAIEPENIRSLKITGIFTGVWSMLVPIAALFVGGAVASRCSGVVTRIGGALHGLIVWGLSTLVGAWLLATVLMSALGGLAATAVTAGGAAAGVVGQADAVVAAIGLEDDDAVRAINKRLRAEGKPAVTTEQIRAATKDVVQDALGEGRLDRAMLVDSIAQHTKLSRADTEQLAGRFEARFDAAKERIQVGALTAAEVTGAAFWGLFAGLVFGLASAIFGASLGVPKRPHVWSEALPPVSYASPPPSFPPPFPPPPREVYP